MLKEKHCKAFITKKQRTGKINKSLLNFAIACSYLNCCHWGKVWSREPAEIGTMSFPVSVISKNKKNYFIGTKTMYFDSWNVNCSCTNCLYFPRLLVIVDMYKLTGRESKKM